MAQGAGTARGGRIDIADVAMLATVTIWACNTIVTKSALDRIDPIPYVFCRFLLVCALVFPLMALRGGIVRIERADRWRILFTGMAGFAVYNALSTAGLRYTTAFSGAILFAMSPVVTMALASVLRIERARRAQWIGLALSATGMAVYVGDKLLAGAPAIGDLLSILGVLAFASYSVATRPLVQRYGAMPVTAWSCLVGLVALTPFAMPSLLTQDWVAVGVSAWAAIAYSAVLSMLVAYTIWGWAIERSGVGRTAPFLYIGPVIAGVISALTLGEEFTVMKIAGATLALAGVVVARSAAGRDLRGWRAAWVTGRSRA
jgi:drug/metabolite transporter (DMT)-like permease